MPFFLLLFLFVMVPIAEISLLIRVGGSIGTFNTIVFVIFTAVLGAYLVRQQGFATLNKLQGEMNAGRMPAMQIAEGVALLFAGAVLMTPGFMTDAVGFAILVPAIRQTFISWAGKNLIKGNITPVYTQSSADFGATGRQSVNRGDVIEGEFTSQSDERK